MNVAIQAAKNVTALVPSKPKKTLVGGEASRLEQLVYYTYLAAAVAAWQYAAIEALNNAISNAPPDWRVDHESNVEFIRGCRSIAALEQLCDPSYPWSGRRLDQI